MPIIDTVFKKLGIDINVFSFKKIIDFFFSDTPDNSSAENTSRPTDESQPQNINSSDLTHKVNLTTAETDPNQGLSLTDIQQLEATAAGGNVAGAGTNSQGGFGSAPLIALNEHNVVIESISRDLNYAPPHTNSVFPETSQPLIHAHDQSTLAELFLNTSNPENSPPAIPSPPTDEQNSEDQNHEDQNLEDQNQDQNGNSSNDNNSGSQNNDNTNDSSNNPEDNDSGDSTTKTYDLNGWAQIGHEHTDTLDGALFLSTYNRQHLFHGHPIDPADPEEPVTTNKLTPFLDLSEDALNIQTHDASEGSAVSQPLYLHPGDVLSFDYQFGTNDQDTFFANNFGNDYAFLSLSGMGHQSVYAFADTYHPDLAERGENLDNVDWVFTTTWQSADFTVPETWEAGLYQVGFGIVDVFSPFNTVKDSSFVAIEDFSVLSSDQGNFDISLSSGAPNYDIFGLNEGDILHFSDVLDSQAPLDGQPNFEDVIQSWMQSGQDIVAQLQNGSEAVFHDVGEVPVTITGFGTNAELGSYLTDMLHVTIEINS